ncbi:MAG: Crp/Fnr family transcriptional regulator [Chloroflexi bacterium]|nr:Crp/Fnr family transcriptional regulator [Chloroflexota bacterium]MDL1886056.1 Crp/Fnr family transcriptional regulator [Anaerolineae bacterium CFX8]
MGIDWNAIPYFRGLDPCGLKRIQAAGRRHIYQAGAVIFNEGEACAGFYVVLDGLVRIYRMNAEGRLHTLSLLRPLSTFNEVAAVDGGPNPFNAVAVTNAEALVISHDRLLNLMAAERVLLSNTVQALAHLNREYIERLEDMTFRSIPSRLAKLFLYESTAYADQIAEAPTQLTQEEIAAILGTTREVVGRALRGLLNAGLLKKRGRHVYIADRRGLEWLAETNTMPERVPNR